MSQINDKQRNKGIYRNVSLFDTSPNLSKVHIITLWNYETAVYIQSFMTDKTLFLRRVVGKKFER